MIDTKPNLSDSKFEQCITDTLHLSGCTNVFGEFVVQSGATLSILSNHGTGKVLTSDSSGTATWQISAVPEASNGLSICGNNIVLGGQLTGNTVVNIANHNLFFCSAINPGRGISFDQTVCDELRLSWRDTASACTNTAILNGLSISLLSEYFGGGCSAGLEITHTDNRICFNSTGATKTYHEDRGLYYVCNYSLGASNRWLPDKGYVDGLLTGNTSASGERITKLICQTSHGFNVGNVLGWSGGTYNKAIASGTYDGEVLGLVSKCYNANCFDLTQAGYVTGLTGLVASSTYYLSPTTAGLLTNIEPTGDTQISKTMLIATSITDAWVLPYPGYYITSGSSTGGSSLSEFTIIGNSSATGFTVNHAKNKQFVAVEVVRGSSPYDTIYTSVQRTNDNCVCVTFDIAPAIGQQFKILITS